MPHITHTPSEMTCTVIAWNTSSVSTGLVKRLDPLMKKHAPDILLTQEGHSPFTSLPDAVCRGWYLHWQAKTLGRSVEGQGTGIIATRLPLKPLAADDLHGWCAIGVVELPVGPTAFVSLHAPTTNKDHEAFGLTNKTCGAW